MLGSTNLIREHLRDNAKLIRETYLKKPFPKGNVAVIEVHLVNDISLSTGATSRARSPTPKPKSKLEGGQFEPIIDFYSNLVMDTNAEYKALSAIADTLDLLDKNKLRGELYLYTERKPCESCVYVLQQFKGKYPNIEIAEIFWDYPYPPVFEKD
ncbi:MAG: deaminase domain-containing protein [Cyanobacteria bacterium P01_A01_bin.83]